MSRSKVFLVCTLAVLAMACNNHNETEIASYHVQVSAQIGDVARTTIRDDAAARRAEVLWAEGDQIGVVATSNGAISTLDLTSGAGSRSATFEGEILTSNELAESYLAFYPNQQSATIDNGRLRLTLPTEQRNGADGIDGAACGFMLSRASGTVDALSFAFENLFAVLKLSLTGRGEQLARIEFSGGAGELVSGDFEVDWTNELAIEFCDVATTRTHLQSNQILGTDPATLYVVVPAITYSMGYSVRVTTVDGRTMVRTVGRSSGRELQRGVIYNLPTLEFDSEAIDLSLGGRANCYVVSEAGRYCFDSGLTDGVAAEMIWEDSEGLISEVALTSDGYVTFDATALRGNALLALRNSEGAIIGSWHIWATEAPKAQIYSDGTVALDRNLGAKSPTDIGLYYQWGRSAPFTSTPEELGEGTLTDGVGSPQKFLTNWSDVARSADLWGNGTQSAYSKVQGAKSAVDPCPAGWRVAPPIFYQHIAGLLKKSEAGGYEMSLDEGVAYYPPTNRLTTSGILSGNAYLFLWSNSNYVNTTSTTLYGTYFQFTANANNNSSFAGSGKRLNANKTYGMNVRCVAE